MKYIVYTFYSYFIFAGGFRNYSSELFLQQECNNLSLSSAEFMLMSVGENAVFILSLTLLIFPLLKYLHLAVFAILFSLNFYFQNLINYEKYIVFIDFVPLIFFFYIHYKNDFHKLNHFKTIVIRIIAIGFVTAVAGKVNNGWMNPEVPVIQSFVFFVSNILTEPNMFHVLFLKIDNHVLYKFLDYSILLYQLLAIVVFIKPDFFKPYATASLFFHVGIMLLLNISFFFPYILVYGLMLMKNNEKTEISKNEQIVAFVLVLTILTIYILNQFDVLFLPRLLNYHLYIHLSDIYTILSIVVFCFLALHSTNKSTIFTTLKISAK